jgi:branched-chain amino acid transport system substrate-binding protein
MRLSTRRSGVGFAALMGVGLLILTACGSGSKGVAESSASSETSSDSAPAAQQSGSDIVIGISVPLTGSAAAEGGAIANAAQLAVDDANKAGGIDGQNVKLDVVDNAGEAAQCATAAQKIASSSAVVMIGAYFSSCTLASAPVANKEKIPLIVETSSAVDITKPDVAGDWVYRISPNSDMDTLALVEFLKEADVKSVYFLSENTDFGLGAEESYTKAMKGAKIEVAGSANFDISAQSFSSQVTAAIGSGADAWIVTSEVQQTAQIMKERMGQGGTAAVFTSGGSVNPEQVVEIAGAKASVGMQSTVYFPTFDLSGVSQPDLANDVIERWAEKGYPAHSITEGARGYAAVQVAVDSLKRASNTSDRASVRDAIAKTDIDTVIYGHVKFLDECGLVHQNEPVIYMSKIQADGSVTVEGASHPPYGCLE